MTALALLAASALLAVPSGRIPHFVKKVDVGGYKLSIECQGRGTPTVVLDSGFSTNRSAWFWTTPRVRTTTRVCSYDRAGLGLSDSRPDAITPTTAQIVDELHTLLHRANLPGPYVLGGWSIGGFDIRYYQHRYPADVAGLITVDGTPPLFLLASSEPIESPLETMYTHAAAQELSPPPALGSIPVLDLTHGVPLDEGEALWVQEQTRFTSSSTNALFVRARGSGHPIAEERPGLVAYGIKLVVKSVRKSTPLPPCPATRIPKLRGACLAPR